MWRNRFGGGFEPVIRQNIERMNDVINILSMTVQNAFNLYVGNDTVPIML
jgi:hypothetical protein